MSKKLNKKNQTDANGTIIVPPPKSISKDKDHYQRLNYLYQLSTWYTMTNTTSIKDKCNSSKSSSKSNSKSIVLDKSYALARVHNKKFDLISKKLKLNVSPNIKRYICKKCHRCLVPNLTCSMEMKNLSRNQDKKNDELVFSCQCGQEKVFKIGTNRSYKPFGENDNNLVDIA